MTLLYSLRFSFLRICSTLGVWYTSRIHFQGRHKYTGAGVWTAVVHYVSISRTRIHQASTPIYIQESTNEKRNKSNKTNKQKKKLHSALLQVVLILGQFRHQVNFSISRKSSGALLGLSGVAIALPPPTITELRIEADTFIMRLSANFKIIYCENV